MTASSRVTVVTVLNVAVAFILLLVLRSMFFAIAVLAPSIFLAPLGATLAAGLVLSLAGLRLASGISAPRLRTGTRTLNGIVLALHGSVVIVALIFVSTSTKRQFVIPDGYRGDVVVIHGVEGGAETRMSSGYSYLIPQDGILVTRDAAPSGLLRDTYAYRQQDGRIRRIDALWPATIPKTSENLQNDRDEGVFFPRAFDLQDSTGCHVTGEEFYVGTKAHLLRAHRERDMRVYLREHPQVCNHVAGGRDRLPATAPQRSRTE